MWASRLKLREVPTSYFHFSNISDILHLLCSELVKLWGILDFAFWNRKLQGSIFLRVGILLNLNAHLAINLLTSQSNQLTFTFYDIFRFCTKCSSFLFIKVFITCCFSSLRVNYGGEKIKRNDLKRKIIDFWASSDH